MRSEQQKRRKRAREKEHKAVIAASPHRPGDRWQHARWPRGTPDAVVGSIRPDGLVRFSERGGCTAESLPLRLMTERNGWRKVAMGPETAAALPLAKLGPSPAQPRAVVAPAQLPRRAAR